MRKWWQEDSKYPDTAKLSSYLRVVFNIMPHFFYTLPYCAQGKVSDFMSQVCKSLQVSCNHSLGADG